MSLYRPNGNGRSHASEARRFSGGEIHELHDFYIDVGLRAERGGALTLALDLYEAAVRAKPDSALAWYNYGDALLVLKRRDEAIEALRKAVELAPKTALFHYDLGLALYEVGRYAEASEEFAPIVAMDANLERASSNLVLASMTNLALSESELGHADAAAKILGPARSTAVDLLYNLARLHHTAKQLHEARSLAEAAVLLSPRSEDVVHLLGAILLDSGREREALPVLQRATKLNRQCAYAWYALGVTFAHLKQRKKARAAFEKARKLAPDYRLPYYDLACLDALDRKFDAAFNNLELALVRGFSDAAHMRRDTDLKSLRRDGRWKALEQRMKQSESRA